MKKKMLLAMTMRQREGHVTRLSVAPLPWSAVRYTHPYTPTHTLFFFLLVGPLITNAQLVETRALFDAAPFRAPLTLRVCHFIFH